MKRLIVCVSLVAAASTAAAAAVKTHAEHKIVAHRAAPCRVAPADEYFGRLKMSILGIRNVIKDQGAKVDIDPSRANSTLKEMALTEDAVHDWQHKYPCDSWLPGTIFALEHFYGKIHTEFGLRRVRYTYAWLHRDFPHHAIAKLALREKNEASAAPPAAAPVADGALGSGTPPPRRRR